MHYGLIFYQGIDELEDHDKQSVVSALTCVNAGYLSGHLGDTPNDSSRISHTFPYCTMLGTPKFVVTRINHLYDTEIPRMIVCILGDSDYRDSVYRQLNSLTIPFGCKMAEHVGKESSTSLLGVTLPTFITNEKENWVYTPVIYVQSPALTSQLQNVTKSFSKVPARLKVVSE